MNVKHGSIFLLAACLAAVAPASDVPRRGLSNAEEPWVFRTVLDDRPRILVAALGDSAWAAWDTETGSLYQVWQPGAFGVKLTGAVYDGKHGPQPSTDGRPVYHSPVAPTWFLGTTGAKIRYKGHRFGAPGQVSLIYAIGPQPVTIEETPTLKAGLGIILNRTFRVIGLPDGQSLTLELGADAGVWSASGAGKLLEESGRLRLVFNTDGETLLTGTWTSTK